MAAAVFFFQDKDLHDLVEKKKREERRSYPEILQKLTLYLEAGLTVRSAFCRVAEDYEKERKRGGRCREAYEEMLIATREIHMGVPEGAAYENFGEKDRSQGICPFKHIPDAKSEKGQFYAFTAIKGRVCPGGRTADTECQKTQ